MNEPQAVAARDLTVNYAGHCALREVGFALPSRAFLTILGPNGSGKSTLLRVLLGLVHPSAGNVRLFDAVPDRASADLVGYVPQIKTLDRTFPAVSRELVATGLLRRWPWWLSGTDKARVHEALQRVGAGHLTDRSVGHLSGGELQRVYLARALVRQPRLVLLDEPATGIDAKGEEDFYHLLESHHEHSETTIVMVTHDWAAARHHATHVLLLKTHQVAFGPPAEVLTEANMRSAFGHVGHRHGQYWMEAPHA